MIGDRNGTNGSWKWSRSNCSRSSIVADLRDEAGRQGDRPDRAVDRHREALADPDDVALGRPLEAVAATDDPDVVAAQAEVLVEVADVLVHAAGQRVDVRRDEADLHRRGSLRAAAPLVAVRLRPPRLVERGGRWRAARDSRGRDPCRRGGPGRRRRPGRRARTCGAGGRTSPSWPPVAVERAVVVGLRRRGSPPAGPSAVAAGERRPARSRSARASWASLLPTVGQPVLGREADDAAVPRPPERRRVERLDRVGPDARVRVGEQPAQDPALGAQRVGHERVGRDREAALVVDLGDRRPQRPQRLDPLLDEQRQEVAAERRDLLADDDLDARGRDRGPSSGRRPRHRSARGR